jgi:hypothetical protein
MLSDGPTVHTLAPGEADEVSVMGSTSTRIYYDLFAFRGDRELDLILSSVSMPTLYMVSMAVNYEDLVRLVEQQQAAYGRIGEWDAVVVATRRDGVVVPLRRWELVERGPRAVRLCWVNAYGALDYHTFEHTGRRSVVSEKSRVCTDGYEVGDSAARRLFTVRSEWVDAATLEWLAGVVTSPRVWLCSGQTFRRLDVQTSVVEMTDDRPAALTLTLCDAQKTQYQKF